MRAVVQRVDEASVSVSENQVGRTGEGLLIYLGIGEDDGPEDIAYLTNKISGLRIFADENNAMNLSIGDIGGSALVISQFTLYGDVRRGRRPSFAKAMRPEEANALYESFVSRLSEMGIPCGRGEFGAMMRVSSINNGPVTILLDSKKTF